MTQWRRSAVECQACGYRWEDVAPVGVPECLICPACAQESGRVPTDDEYDRWAGYRFSGNTP